MADVIFSIDQIEVLVADLRRTRTQAVAWRNIVTKEGGTASQTGTSEVPIHGEIAIRAADAIEQLLGYLD